MPEAASAHHDIAASVHVSTDETTKHLPVSTALDILKTHMQLLDDEPMIVLQELPHKRGSSDWRWHCLRCGRNGVRFWNKRWDLVEWAEKNHRCTR